MCINCKISTRKISGKYSKLALILVPFIILSFSIVYAMPGALDPSFGSAGKLATDFGGYDAAFNVAVQYDGRIVVNGHSNSSGSNSDFAVARYYSDGTLDPSFDSDGKLVTDFGSDDQSRDIVIQPDGNIIVAGYASNGSNNDFAVARYNPDGSLDTSFDTDGKVITDFIGGEDSGNAVALQTDGKIVVAGGGSDLFTVARYNPDGSLDTDFDGDGKVTTDLGTNDDAYGLAIQSDEKILVGGMVYNGTNFDFALVRYNPDGSLDTSFHTDGKVTTNLGKQDMIQDVAIQSDGKIVAVGQTGDINDFDFAVVRYDSSGNLDTSFSTDGIVTTDFNDKDYGTGVVIQADGKIVVVGYTGLANFALARYTSAGVLDTSFDSDGMVTTDFGAEDHGLGIAIQRDGKIVAAGLTAVADFALARYEVTSSSTQAINNGGGSATLEGVTITNNSSNTCSFTVIKNPVPPGGAPLDPGEMPIQWHISSDGNCGSLNVNLSFSYTDTELANGNNITESNLVAFENTGPTSWSNRGGTVDTGANKVTVTGVTSLSSWTIGDPTSSGNNNPTVVLLADFSTQMAPGSPLILFLGIFIALVCISLLFLKLNKKVS